MKLPQLKMTDLAGIGTWAMVYGLSLYWLIQTANGYHSDILLVSLLFMVYLTCLILVTRERPVLAKQSTIISVLLIQLASAFALMWLLPLSFLPILTIIWASILPHLISIGRTVIITFLTIVLWFGIYKLRWQQEVFFSAMLYASFHMFAILMMHHAKAAEKATEEALQLNAELLSTRKLLSEATRQNERTRIARDLHDLLGHHLTALIINLQIANHLTEGEAKDKVAQCHSLAKLLMSDVREAVTSLRENNSLDFESMVNQLIEHLPSLRVHSAIEANINLEDIQTAKQLLSCIQEAMTNTIKHSGANELWISLTANEQTINLSIHDNGKVNPNLLLGNGLIGMQERVESVNGTSSFDTSSGYLQIRIQIPRSSHADTNHTAQEIQL
jgi:two-component system, NarL family, sensor histidine kinase DesK